MLLFNDKLHFRNLFFVYLWPKKIMAIRRPSGLLPSNNWALLGFNSCSSSKKILASC